MSAYEDDADRLAEHDPETCDEPFCQICETERTCPKCGASVSLEYDEYDETKEYPSGKCECGHVLSEAEIDEG